MLDSEIKIIPGKIEPQVHKKPEAPMTQTGSQGGSGRGRFTAIGLHDRGGDRGGNIQPPVPPTAEEDRPEEEQQVRKFVEIWTTSVPPEVDALNFGYRERPSLGVIIDDLAQRSVSSWYLNQDISLTIALIPLVGRISAPAREFIRVMYDYSLARGEDPSSVLPLDTLGINLEARQFGPYDSKTNFGDFESRLLEQSFQLVGSEGSDMGQRLDELNHRWQEAYIQRYSGLR